MSQKEEHDVPRALTWVAKLPFHLHSRLLQHRDEYMGNRDELDDLRPTERRLGWCSMGVFYCLDGLLLCLCLAGRDGFDVGV